MPQEKGSICNLHARQFAVFTPLPAVHELCESGRANRFASQDHDGSWGKLDSVECDAATFALLTVAAARWQRHMEARMKAKRTVTLLLFLLAWASLAYGEAERLTDAQIAGVVFVANQAEIAAGESALRRSQSRSVQALAKRIVAEHGQVNQEIIALTQRLAATLQRSAASDALTNQSVDDLARLNEVETHEFDEAYLDREVVYLQQLVKSVDAFIRSATSAELKMLLVRFRPFFILHLDQAQRLKLAIGTPEIGR
jgi:putative membrane protein